jgi:hypothetical protein
MFFASQADAGIFRRAARGVGKVASVPFKAHPFRSCGNGSCR